MNSAHVLVLHGSPGSGKTALARPNCQLLLRAAVPAALFAVCELTARAHRPLARTDLESVRDVLVSTHDRSEEDAAREVLRSVRWIT